MKLLIVESPAKAKTISKYLDGKYTVKASVGHIRDLPKSNKNAIDIKAGFVPRYEITKGKEKIVSEIKSLAKKSDEVLLATDPDREGEAIAWHIKEAVGLKSPKRVVFYEITKDAVKEAVEHPREIDENLKQAQEARRVLDRLVGYDLSGLIWKKVRYGLSAGRVQSPALRIIMEREREIRAFKPEKYWVIKAEVKAKNGAGEQFTVVCEEEPRNEKEVEKILEASKTETWTVKEISETETKRSPRPPFTTSTLQQAASSRLGFAPSRTMNVAQKLYESGKITYMRTDSVNLSNFAVKNIASAVEEKYGKKYLFVRSYKSKNKNAQEAHEAIRPTNVFEESTGINEEQKKLYRLIWQRAISSQMADAKIMRSKITAYVGKGKTPDFSATGSRINFDGWLAADPQSKGEEIQLPKVAENETLKLLEIASEGKQTEPPPRYTEAGLVKELENRGIGRPSTYATIIKTLQDRSYVEKINKALHPTDTGDVVSSFLEKNFADYISDSFTADMEDKLDDMADGKIKYEKTLRDFYEPFAKEIKLKEKVEKITNLGQAEKSIKCPICSGQMIIKLGRSGKFFSCAKFPDCSGARKITGEEMAGPKDTGEICPECKIGKLMEREGRFGKFIACDNYPKCKYIKKDASEEEKKDTGVNCPVCKKGTMVEKRGRFGVFYSCSNYPKCRNAIKSKPTGNICGYKKDNGTVCEALMMEGTKTIPQRCSDKNCPNHNPHKLVKK